MMGSPDLCGSKGQSTLSGRFVLPPSLKTAQRSRQRQENELDSLKSTREDACAPVGRLRSEDRPVRPLASSSSVGHDQRTKMTNEGDVLGLVRLRYPLSVRFDFGYNRHILERGCEGEVLLRCGTNKRKCSGGLADLRLQDFHSRADVLLLVEREK